MEAIARALDVPLGDGPEAGIAVTLEQCVTLLVAPGHGDRLAACFEIAAAQDVAPAVWIRALSEAANWGIHGENQRLVVIGGRLALLWTPPPQSSPLLVARLHELAATALALFQLVIDHPVRHRAEASSPADEASPRLRAVPTPARERQQPEC